MGKQKKQHYVPQMYLRRFLFDDKRFYLFNLNSMKDIGLVGYKDQCYIDNFYGEDKEWENKLSKKEGAWNKAIEEVLNDNYAHLNDLREFVVFQLGRTDAYYERALQNTSRIYEEYLKMGTLNQNLKYDESLIKKASREKAKDIISPSKNLDLIDEFSDLISDLAFVKIHYKTSKKLISSDNPVLLLNPYIPHNVGLGIIGLVIICPLNPENLGVFYDRKIYPKFNGKFKVQICNEYEIEKINALTLANAKTILFSAFPFDKSIFKQKYLKLRENNLKKETVEALGPQDDKLLVTHQNTIYHPFQFSFSKIETEFYKIKTDYREPVLRLYEKGWSDKLHLKFQEPFIHAISSVSDDINPNDYKRGYKQFYEIMLKYWEIDSDC